MSQGTGLYIIDQQGYIFRNRSPENELCGGEKKAKIFSQQLIYAIHFLNVI